MNKKEKTIIAGVGAILAYLFLRQNEKGKILNISSVSIYPTEIFA